MLILQLKCSSIPKITFCLFAFNQEKILSSHPFENNILVLEYYFQQWEFLKCRTRKPNFSVNLFDERLKDILQEKEKEKSSFQQKNINFKISISAIFWEGILNENFEAKIILMKNNRFVRILISAKVYCIDCLCKY